MRSGAIIIGAATAAAGVGAYFLLRENKKLPLERSAPMRETEGLPVSLKPVDIPTLDTGLSILEARAISVALSVEVDGANLRSFGDSLSPTYPVASSLLFAKGSLLGAPYNPDVGLVGDALSDAVRTPVANVLAIPLQPAAVAAKEKNIVSSTVFLASAKTMIVAGDDRMRVGLWFVIPAVIAVVAAVDEDFRDEVGEVIKELAKLGYQVIEVVAQVLKALAPFVGLIPGIGQGLAAAMTIAGSLALGDPLDQALLNTIAAAIPGGALVKTAFEVAITTGKGIIEGKAWDDVLLDVGRQQAESKGGPMAAAAFDAGVALAKGKDLQEAGFSIYMGWCKGNEIAERAGSFANKAARAAREGRNVADVLIDEAKDELASRLPNALARATGIDAAIQKILASPGLLGQSIEETAKQIGQSVEATQAAFMCLKKLDTGVVIVDPAIRKRFDSATLMPDRPLLQAQQRMIYQLTEQGRPYRLQYGATIVQQAQLPAATARAIGIAPPVSRGGEASVATAPVPVAPEIDVKTRKRNAWVAWYAAVGQVGVTG